MDEGNGPIYGLELQARALAPQLGEGNEICFLIGTNSLKPINQVHLIEFNDEQSMFKSKIFEHSLGEIWKISSCPQDKQLIATCFAVQKVAQVQTQAALLTLPFEEEEQTNNTEYLQWKHVEILDTEQYGNKVKCLEFHPSIQRTLACVVDGKIVIFDRTDSKTRMVTDVMASNPNAKNIPQFTTGKWSPHHQGQQFIVLHDCAVRCYDIRDTRHAAWQIDNAHTQLVRDLDCNPNKQCHLVTGGDDGYIKVWDSRMAKDPLIKRNDHAHWIWSVRFNTYHDQLILSSSSDCKVNLTCAGSVSSENGSPVLEYKEIALSSQTAESEERCRVLSDGLLQTFDQHEDSVYAAEWSNVDPWLFTSLSYDGRLLISKVPKEFKYEIMF